VRDAPIDGLIRKTLSAADRDTPDPCANQNSMAAYLESSLSPEETAEFEAHISVCEICRETLALWIRLQNRDEAGRPVSASPADSRTTIFRFSLPLPVLAGLLLAAVLIPAAYRLTRRSDMIPPKSQVAELRAPSPGIADSPVLRKSSEIKPGIKPAKEPAAIQPPRAQALVPEKKGKTDFSAEPGEQLVPPAPAMKAEAAIAAETTSRRRADASAPSAADEKSPTSPAPPQMTVNQSGSIQGISLNSVPPKDLLLDAGKNIPAQAATKQIGDKAFYRSMGIWIDRQCSEYRDNPIIEILSVAPEYEPILTGYPELRGLLPVLVHWKGKNYLLR
jgi:anti-sigma factor RsiW